MSKKSYISVQTEQQLHELDINDFQLFATAHVDETGNTYIKDIGDKWVQVGSACLNWDSYGGRK